MAVNKDAEIVTQDKSNTENATKAEIKAIDKPGVKPDNPSAARPVSTPADRATKTKASSGTKSAVATGGKQGLLWLLVLLLVVAVIGLAYMQWQAQTQYSTISNDQTGQSAYIQRWQQEHQALSQRVSDLSVAHQVSQANFTQQQDDLNAQVTEIDQALIKSMELMAKEQLDQGVVLPQWQLAEAEYLLRLANQRLAMEQASSSAIALLHSANIIVRDSEQVGTYGVRRAIAADIAALTSVPSIDVEGVYAQLAALAEQASQLTFIPPRSAVPQVVAVVTEIKESTTTNAEPVHWSQVVWQSTQAVSASVWDELKQLVKVQSRTQADQQLLTPAAELLVRMRIEMALTQAQVALLRRQQAIYNESLTSVQQLLQQYYRANDPVAQAMKNQINTLADVKVLVTMPNIRGSLGALQSFIATLHDTSSVPAVQE